MRKRSLFVTLLLLAAVSTAARAEETIVFLRHGEKPSGGYGQLTCQGFNRSLALPLVLTSKFGQPDRLYAPSPAVKVTDTAGSFYYVRPLATIEPTAIKLGMPVNTKYGYNAISSLQTALISTGYATATIFVAWEHLQLVKLVQSIMNAYGGGVAVPAWPSTDYDSLYVVRVNYVGHTINAQFTRESEGLNGQPTACPY
ncbi:MAG: hypothetical protein ACRD2I_23895 [Vicinamibacterales bacterium]